MLVILTRYICQCLGHHILYPRTVGRAHPIGHVFVVRVGWEVSKVWLVVVTKDQIAFPVLIVVAVFANRIGLFQTDDLG